MVGSEPSSATSAPWQPAAGPSERDRLLTAGFILDLQRRVGNQIVTHLVARPDAVRANTGPALTLPFWSSS